MPRSWTTAALAVALLAPLALASCGSPDPEPSSASTGTATGGAFPVTLRHQFGSPTIERAPQRVVATTDALADMVVAFGVQPVASYADPTAASPGLDGRFTGARDAKLVDAASHVSAEQVAGYDPDLVVAESYGLQGGGYERVSAVAPVVTGKEANDDWTAKMRAVGTALGHADQVDARIAEAEKPMKQVAARHPELRGGTYAWVAWEPSKRNFRYGNGSVFETLGLKPHPGQDNTQTTNAGLALENVDKLDATVLAIWCQEGDGCASLKKDPRFARLPAVKGGRVLFADLPTAVAVNSPAPSGLSFVADKVSGILDRSTGSPSS